MTNEEMHRRRTVFIQITQPYFDRLSAIAAWKNQKYLFNLITGEFTNIVEPDTIEEVMIKSKIKEIEDEYFNN